MGPQLNNYTLYQPASPDGTVRLGYGVAGSVTDILTLKNSRLGIGTNDPQASLHAHNTSGTTLLRTSVNANSTVGFEIVKTGSTTQSWRIVDGQTINGALEFYDVTDSTTRMIIRDGKVGIGTSNPTQKLVVKGTTSLMATNSTNQWMAYTYTDNTFRLNYNGAGADEVTINSNGDVSLLQNLIIPEDKKIFLEGDADDDYNAIWKDDAENALMLTSRFRIANIIDSNNDDTDSFWSVRHNGVDIAGSGELMRVRK